MDQGEIRAVLEEVGYPGHSFRVGALAGGASFLQITYAEADVETGQMEEQRGRKWFISEHATRGEVVQTALKAALTSAEHRVREHFTYKGERIFGPHFDLDALVELASAGRIQRRADGAEDGGAPAGRTALVNTRPHRSLKLTPKGLAAACLLAATAAEGASEEAVQLADRLYTQIMDGAPAAPLLPEVRRLRELLGEHPFGARVDRDVLPWLVEQAGAGAVH